MPVTVKETSGTQSLQGLEAVIRGAESIMGPLCTFGAGETDTAPINLMSFEDAGSPANEISLEEVSAGEAPGKAGHVLVCLARAFVNGQLKVVAAFRPT